MNFYYEDRLNLIKSANIPKYIYENKNFSYLAHWHNDVEIAWVKEGSIYVGINNERRLLNEGDIALCSSGDIHYYEDTNCPACVIILIFKPEFIGDSSTWPENRKFISSFIEKEFIAKSDLFDIYDLLNSILKEERQKDEYYDLYIKSSIAKICAILLRHFPSIETNDKSKTKSLSQLKLIQDIMIYIENNYDNDISLLEISDHFNIDHFNLSKKFNSVTGMNFKTYINNLRCEKAENMIINTSKSLTDIAYECGFNSIRNFNRVYKTIKGCAPSNLRVKNKAAFALTSINQKEREVSRNCHHTLLH
jgi:AraC-like DNA-binding protein